MKPGTIWGLLRTTISEWVEDRAPRLGAALAFYSVLSLAPLLVIAIAVAGLVFGQEAASGQIVGELGSLVGSQGAEAIQAMIANADRPSAGLFASVVGIATLLFGATGVFGELQDAMNTIWGTSSEKSGGLWAVVRARFLSFAMVFGIAFLVLVSLLLSAALSALGGYLGGFVPYATLMQMVNFAISFLVLTVLFALMFRYLPDVRVAWGDVWIGAFLTSVLFTLGKYLIGLYLGRSSIASAYGAAGSFVALLVWIYYSAQIFIFGAEFTQVYANRYGSRTAPEADGPASQAP